MFVIVMLDGRLKSVSNPCPEQVKFHCRGINRHATGKPAGESKVQALIRNATTDARAIEGHSLLRSLRLPGHFCFDQCAACHQQIQ